MQRNKAATLERVLQSSVQEFARKGFHMARVSDIASLARCSTETIYDVYISKDGLFSAAVDHVIESHFGSVDVPTLFKTHLDGVDCPMDGLCRMATLFGKPLISETFLAIMLQVFGSGTKPPEQAVAAMQTRRNEFDAGLSELVAEAQAQKLFDTGDATAAAHLILSTVGVVEAWRMRMFQEAMTVAHIHESARRAVRAFATAEGRLRLDALPPFEG